MKPLPHPPIPESIRLLMPFAARLAGIRNPLGGKHNVRNKEGFVFNLGWQARLWQYFPMPLEGNVFYNLCVHRDYFSQHPPAVPAFPTQRALQRQPLWPLADGFGAGMSWAERPAAMPRARRSPGAAKRCCLEPAGRYVPASLAGDDAYGLHLSQGGLVNAALAVHAGCPEQAYEVVLATVCHFIHAHLSCHTWIEDICALLDSAAGADTAASPYGRTHRRYGGLLCMEEAICNAVALALLPGFLSPYPEAEVSRDIPRYQAGRIIAALTHWLTQRTRDLALPEPQPFADERQQLHAMTRLLIELFGYAEGDDARAIVADFIGLDDRKHYRGDSVSPAWNRWDEYPVTLHLD